MYSLFSGSGGGALEVEALGAAVEALGLTPEDDPELAEASSFSRREMADLAWAKVGDKARDFRANRRAAP